MPRRNLCGSPRPKRKDDIVETVERLEGRLLPAFGEFAGFVADIADELATRQPPVVIGIGHAFERPSEGVADCAPRRRLALDAHFGRFGVAIDGGDQGEASQLRAGGVFAHRGTDLKLVIGDVIGSRSPCLGFRIDSMHGPIAQTSDPGVDRLGQSSAVTGIRHNNDRGPFVIELIKPLEDFPIEQTLSRCGAFLVETGEHEAFFHVTIVGRFHPRRLLRAMAGKGNQHQIAWTGFLDEAQHRVGNGGRAG